MFSRIGHRLAFLVCLYLLAASGAVRAQVPDSEDGKVVYALGLAVAKKIGRAHV